MEARGTAWRLRGPYQRPLLAGRRPSSRYDGRPSRPPEEIIGRRGAGGAICVRYGLVPVVIMRETTSVEHDIGAAVPLLSVSASSPSPAGVESVSSVVSCV